MSVAVAEEPRVLHELTGRMRIHVPAWTDRNGRWLERELRSIAGVRQAQLNAATANVLILFDPTITNTAAILSRVRRLSAEPASDQDGAAHDHPPPALRECRGRARIAVRGIDRNPQLARAVVDRLQQHPGVKAAANALTGRVLVEFDEDRVHLDDLIAAVSDMELPDLLGDDRPTHPLDPAPLVQSATRTAGAALGLALLAARRLAGFQGPPISNSTPAVVASTVGIVQGFPATRNGLRVLLGRNVADVLFQGAAIVSLALSGNPLGLAVTGSESLRLLTEVVARRAAWRRYTERLGDEPSAQPGTVIRIEAGERVPLAARVMEGTGTAVDRNGLPQRVAPGEMITAGSRLAGGPFVLALQIGASFPPQPRSAPAAPNLYTRYTRALGPASLAYAALTALLTRSLSSTFNALLLVTPRTAVIGQEAADLGASARVLRAGVTVVGTRARRPIRLPNLLLLDSPRVLTDGYEVVGALPATEAMDSAEILARAAGIAATAGFPWGGAFPISGAISAQHGSFDGATATGIIDGIRHTLGPIGDDNEALEVARQRERGGHVLALRSASSGLLGIVNVRPRMATGVTDLAATCKRRGVEIGVLADGSLAARAVARRAGVALLHATDPVAAIQARQAEGALVAFVSDSAAGAAGFDACDLAIGLSSGRSGRFPARADLLSPDLGGLTAILDAGVRRDAATRDAVMLSTAANVAGAVWGFRGAPGVADASRAVHIAALGALADGWLRLRKGERRGAAVTRLADPRPERWGRYNVDEVLRVLGTTAAGLTSETAHARLQAEPVRYQRSAILRAVLDQLRSPLAAILGAGAGLSLLLGAPLDFAIISATLGVNVAVGAWQERRAGQAAATLERLGAAVALVLRDGEPVRVPAREVVPGDILVLGAGDRVAADARLLAAENLEVDEAALTGESLPAAKAPEGGTDAGRVVLEGSDITVGRGRAVVFAVGRATRMGATAAALAIDEDESNPLAVRLSRMLRQVLPLAGAGGAIVVASGLLRGRPLLPQLAIGAGIAIAAVPEGLPLLTGVGQAAVARRLTERNALVRRLNAVEALGRVDIACTDKTGTLTEGRLALTLVASNDDARQLAELGGEGAPDDLRAVLRAAALASPHPDSTDAAAHPTDVAIIQGALRVISGEELRVERTAEAPFDPVRSFHAANAAGALFVKGATEALVPRCTRVRRRGVDEPLDEEGRQALRDHAARLAGRGLRVLMVAEGPTHAPVHDPHELVALGFVGISDPLRADVPAAVRRCQAAGIRVIMLTGDHPATARAIAEQAGISREGAAVLTGAEIADLHNGDLDRRLEDAAVIARVTPLDKLRIVESLQRRGHTVAMTGDGVNDAPALRLADVGVAMGRGGTEVARQAADVVLADDDFATLVEALVEGRSFWRNIRRALGLLLGGNLGELGLVVGASVLGLASPLVTRQILAVNLITDALPALAVALQRPADRNLAGLGREGATALDTTLRDDVVRRGASTAAPALAGYLLALPTGLPQARAVAFASIVATQLAQTLDAGRAEGGLTRPVVAAVAGSAGLLLAALTVPALREALMLAAPTPLGWALIAVGAPTAVVLSRLLGTPGDPAAPLMTTLQPAAQQARLTQPALPTPTPPTPRALRLLPTPSIT